MATFEFTLSSLEYNYEFVEQSPDLGWFAVNILPGAPERAGVEYHIPGVDGQCWSDGGIVGSNLSLIGRVVETSEIQARIDIEEMLADLDVSLPIEVTLVYGAMTVLYERCLIKGFEILRSGGGVVLSDGDGAGFVEFRLDLRALGKGELT